MPTAPTAAREWTVTEMYEELIKRLRERAAWINFPHHGEECPTEDTMLMKQAADAIEELSKPRWIPVTERLPKADEYDARGYAVPYLVMNGWMRVTARRTKDYWVLFGNGTVLEYVTHWMPLPSTEGLNEA